MLRSSRYNQVCRQVAPAIAKVRIFNKPELVAPILHGTCCNVQIYVQRPASSQDVLTMHVANVSQMLLQPSDDAQQTQLQLCACADPAMLAALSAKKHQIRQPHKQERDAVSGEHGDLGSKPRTKPKSTSSSGMHSNLTSKMRHNRSAR
jgi:hypothetical protein